jgi:hypothetical protein
MTTFGIAQPVRRVADPRLSTRRHGCGRVPGAIKESD